MKSRSESDLSQPESDEEGYSLVEHTLLYTFIDNLSGYMSISVFMSCRPRVQLCSLKCFIRLCFLFQSGRRNVDLDLAFSHKKRGKDPPFKGLCIVASEDDPGVLVTLVSLSFDSCVDSLFASFGAVEPQTQEELQASKRWHVSSSC